MTTANRRRAATSAALAAVLVLGSATPALAETVAKFESRDGYGWGKIVWKPRQDGPAGPHSKWPFELTLTADPKDGHGRTGVQWKVVYDNLPDTDWKYFVGPTYNRATAGPKNMHMTSIAGPEGIRFRVCRKMDDGKDVCGSETRLYKR
ncbi:hypothetical protein GCM10022247_32800 [Allokutzneria multivorans]|uniref:Secreted protein n=1 Tax=Allokutzneria multivorans TaxID=1142134 RepID=A0ABP7S8F6_9PSEU